MQPDDATELTDPVPTKNPMPVPVARAIEELDTRARIQNMKDELDQAQETRSRWHSVVGTLSAFCASSARLQEVARLGLQVEVGKDRYGDPIVEIVIPGYPHIEVERVMPLDDIRYVVRHDEGHGAKVEDIYEAIRRVYNGEQ